MKILHATDFSLISKAAEAAAARLAHALDAEIVVLHVVPELQIYGSGRVKIPHLVALKAARVAAATAAVRERVTALRSRALRATGVVRFGPIAGHIIATARRRRCAMIVLGTRGRGGIGRWLLGSTAARVIRVAPCPVLTVRA
jgi:nucleotide-binding universal stress UspA family protein